MFLSTFQSLFHLNGSVAVVAVVGKYHSGKSFLLNQLMSKNSGFGFRVGPTLRPETMGIWMWGKVSISLFTITTEHAQNTDDVRILGDEHEEASVHLQ